MEVVRILLQQTLPERLMLASSSVSGRISREYKTRFGVSVIEWRVIAVLYEYGPLTQTELTDRTLMGKVAIHQACKLLEERHLINRSPNACDRRSHLVDLSMAGQDLYQRIMPVVADISRRIMGVLTVEEQCHFRAMLERVNDQVSRLNVSEFAIDMQGRRYG
ncbi:MarR family winged helix-turn-helix transcriptional regulator [Croceibacterium ferulae]|uniref:MarR family winged helix-turn-helix transcriptional regulator n=1 Tax=Croceibacterium ferulae TaxID=1854641 RepID=UPI000EAD3A1C|nr:MarR family winged helix-turn-helix transcriptional regulator [Croceibacterium ferulae]